MTRSAQWQPWSAALMLATLATPAGVVIAWLAPRPLDAVASLPLVLVDMWAKSHGVTDAPSDDATIARLMLLVLGIGLTWLFYVLVARVVLWRLSLVLILSASVLCVGVSPLFAQRSRAMSLECRGAKANTAENRKKADDWVQEKLKAFLPNPDGSLRMRALEEAEQVKLAFYGISTTCEQYLAGKMNKADADLTLSGFEETIENFYHDAGGEAIALASRAQVSELPKMRTLLTEIGGVGRQAALLGEDKLADEAQKKMVDALTTFSNTFVDHSCWDQSFDDDLPFAVQRQNDMLGTNIDVRPCAQRRFKAQVEIYTFESCTIRGVGPWRVLWNMAAPGTTGGRGEGEMKLDDNRAKGDYKVDWGQNGVVYRASGKMELDREDHGPGQKASYKLSGDMEIKLVKGKEKIAMLEKLMGRETKPAKGKFQMVETEVSDKPCKSLDE